MPSAWAGIEPAISSTESQRYTNYANEADHMDHGSSLCHDLLNTLKDGISHLKKSTETVIKGTLISQNDLNIALCHLMNDITNFRTVKLDATCCLQFGHVMMDQHRMPRWSSNAAYRSKSPLSKPYACKSDGGQEVAGGSQMAAPVVTAKTTWNCTHAYSNIGGQINLCPYLFMASKESVGYLASEGYEGDNAGEMSPGSSTESYPAFARIGLRENPGKNLNQVTCPNRDSNPGHLVSQPDALTVTPQVWTGSRKEYNACSSALSNFLHSPVTSTILAPNIFLSTLFSNTLNLCSSLKVRVDVLQPYRTTAGDLSSKVIYSLLRRKIFQSSELKEALGIKRKKMKFPEMHRTTPGNKIHYSLPYAFSKRYKTPNEELSINSRHSQEINFLDREVSMRVGRCWLRYKDFTFKSLTWINYTWSRKRYNLRKGGGSRNKRNYIKDEKFQQSENRKDKCLTNAVKWKN
ncbi:hypothetical protein ANN_04466 [Periplaneta americana]|uniref:Uncharacterized protein n=1 Tax=Periplaneta americana TaxID=6978 RepID=A0ABQ8T8M2_PERAM|nr:hypothetical protein ANN_04466 [Periplaneta americana]